MAMETVLPDEGVIASLAREAAGVMEGLVPARGEHGDSMVRAWMVLAVAAALLMPAGPEAAAAEALAGAAVAEPPTVEALLSEALEQSAELRALEERIRAAEASVGPAGALPDPMVGVGLSNIPVGSGIALDEDMMSGVMLMASQAVPPGSMRRQMREAQAAEAEMLRAELADARNDLVRRVKRAYVDVQFRDEAVEIARRNRDLAEDMLRTAEALYATGKAMQQHVFEAQVRLSQMVDMVVMHQREREAMVARLNRLLYRPPDAPLPGLPALAKGSAMVDAEGLRALAEDGNAGLDAMRRGVVHAERMAGATAAGEKPHVVYSFEYMIRQPMGEMGGGTDMWSASVGMSLPWVRRSGKLDREVEAAEARRAAAEREVEAMRNELGAMVEEHATDVRRVDEQLALLETGLMPQAEGAYAAARASYATGMGELTELLDNQMNLYNLELQRAMLLAERGRSMAELEYMVGGPLTAVPAEPEVATGVE